MSAKGPFSRASAGVKSALARQVSAKPCMPTLKERIDTLKAQRPKPQLQRQLTPGGAVETNVHKQQAADHQKRIQALVKNRIEAKEMIQRGLRQADRHLAKSRDFGHSR